MIRQTIDYEFQRQLAELRARVSRLLEQSGGLRSQRYGLLELGLRFCEDLAAGQIEIDVVARLMDELDEVLDGDDQEPPAPLIVPMA